MSSLQNKINYLKELLKSTEIPVDVQKALDAVIEDVELKQKCLVVLENVYTRSIEHHKKATDSLNVAANRYNILSKHLCRYDDDIKKFKLSLPLS
jgi:hypothetical protein